MPVVFWKWWRTERLDRETGEQRQVEEPVLRYYRVFND